MVTLRIKDKEAFKSRFPYVDEEDIYYDEGRDILHIGLWKKSIRRKGEAL